jgi:hypothetical protein
LIEEAIEHARNQGMRGSTGRKERPLKLVTLEDRIVFSATPLAVLPVEPGIEPADGQSLSETPPPEDQSTQTAQGEDQAAASDGNESETSAGTSPRSSASPTADASDDGQTAADSLTVSRHELVIIDAAVGDYQQFIDDLLAGETAGRDIEFVVLDENRDGVDQISEVLAQYDDLDALHIVSHGTDGQVKLGSEWLDNDNVNTYAGQISQWADAMTSDADLLIYGCDLAGNDDGQMLVESLGTLTGADTMASTDNTGSAILNGEWSSAAIRHELVILDPSVQNSAELRDLLLAQQEDGRDLEFFVLDANRNGVEQIAEILAQYDDLDAVHVLSHGTAEGLQLGSTWLDAQSINDYAETIRGWQGAFDSDADLLLYGCDLAGSDAGRSLVNTLGRWTGADVAASTDLTGYTLFGGDWQLEYQTGHIEATVVAGQQTQADWHGLMAVSVNSTSFAKTSASSPSLSWSHTVASQRQQPRPDGQHVV